MSIPNRPKRPLLTPAGQDPVVKEMESLRALEEKSLRLQVKLREELIRIVGVDPANYPEFSYPPMFGLEALPGSEP